MTEYEMADLTGAAMGNFLTAFTVFVSIVTAYVVAAFAAGAKLTRVQVTIVNACFLLASGTLGILSLLIFQVFLRRAQALTEISQYNTASPLTLDFTWVLAMLYTVLVVGSLVFMHSVRRSQPAEDD